MKVWITGESSFIARNLNNHFIERGDEHWIINSLSEKEFDQHRTYNCGYKGYKNEVDIFDVGLREIIKKADPDIIIHNAAVVGTDYCTNYKELALKTNINGTFKIILKNINHLMSLPNRNAKIGINYVVDKSNLHEIKDFYNFFNNKVDFISFLPKFSFSQDSSFSLMNFNAPYYGTFSVFVWKSARILAIFVIDVSVTSLFSRRFTSKYFSGNCFILTPYSITSPGPLIFPESSIVNVLR